jgi:hypothetical protein
MAVDVSCLRITIVPSNQWIDVNLSRERNSKLVPELLKRLKELQARGEEERERIRSVFKLD